MNKNKKLWWSIVLTALITFPAGWAFGNGAINKGLVNALASVGQNLFGDGNFGVSIVGSGTPDDGSPAADVVQIDIASGTPPDDGIPVYLNVFVPPTPIAPACEVMAQIAVTPEGVRFIINPDVVPAGISIVETGTPLGAPPDPCRDGNVLGGGDGI